MSDEKKCPRCGTEKCVSQSQVWSKIDPEDVTGVVAAVNADIACSERERNDILKDIRRTVASVGVLLGEVVKHD